MAQKTVVIKKYENRRLYDTTNSRYVNLEEVAQLLQQGNDVQVVDAASGEDITRLVLTQIIVEDAKTPESNFPLDLLRQMVVSTGRVSQESAIQYMKTMVDIYQNAYRAIPNPLSPFDFVQNDRATREKRNEGNRGTSPNKASEARETNVKDPDREEVNELRDRVAELEKLVSTIAGPKKAGKKRK
jgi:polyhydroxyalkanoate synthesis repressor PhaR